MNIIPTEHEEAKALAEYLEILQKLGKIQLYSHLSQETFVKNWGVKMKQKQEGVRRGVPDYIIITNKEVLFIELKRIKGSTISHEQQDWIIGLKNKKTKAKICEGFDKAKEFIEMNI